MPHVLLARMRRFRMLDAIDWATRCAEGDDAVAQAEAIDYLEQLRCLPSSEFGEDG